VQGYIKDYRKELGSDIWLMPPLFHRVWQYLKYMANHEDNNIPMRDGSKMLIKKGQHLHSVRGIAQGVGWYEGAKWKEPNPKTVTVILDWLVQNEMITIERGKGNRQYTLITLLNWDSYQVKEDRGNSKETRNGEGRKHETDINNNEKNVIKNDKDIYTLFDYWNSKKIIVHRELNQRRISAIKARLENYPLDILLKTIDNYIEILNSDKYFYSYKFNLEDFLNPKNLDRFLDENNPYQTMLKNEFKDQRTSKKEERTQDKQALLEKIRKEEGYDQN
jgi:hypothetical protein